jgi:hypothetical protein
MATEDYTLDDAQADIADLRAQVTLLEEAHQQIDSGGNTPNTPANANASHVLYSASGTPAWVSSSGLQMGMQGAQATFFPLNTVTSVTPTLGNLASGTYQGNDASVGSVYEVEAWGNGTWANPVTTLEFAVVWAGFTMTNTTFGTTAMPAGQTFRWWARARVICHTTGGSGTWSSFVLAIINSTGNVSPGNADMGCATSCENNTTQTIDSTVNESLSLRATWGAANGGTLTSQVAFFRRVC